MKTYLTLCYNDGHISPKIYFEAHVLIPKDRKSACVWPDISELPFGTAIQPVASLA